MKAPDFRADYVQPQDFFISLAEGEEANDEISTLIDQQKELIPFMNMNEEKALHAIKATNIFSSHSEREKTLQMAALCGLMYKNFEEISTIEAFFPHGLIILPSPEEMGMQNLPNGLRVQAFRHGDEVIVAMRGTELDSDLYTSIGNLLADAGIGHHKSNSDILNSIDHTKARLKSLYNYELDSNMYNPFKKLLEERITGDTDTERAVALLKEVGKDGLKGGAIGGAATGGLATLGTLGLVALGALSGPLGLTIVCLSTLGGVAAGFGTNSTITSYKKGATLADGYPTLISYVKAIDTYINRLKETKIRNTDTLITTGHSLAGFLCGVTGAMHADEAYSFNGPGVVNDKDVKCIMKNLGFERNIHDHFELYATSMEGDFIGNFGTRDGSKRTLYLPITLGATENFPNCSYENILSHHGIILMNALLRNTTVESFPIHLKGLPILLLEGRKEEKEEPQVEEIDD